MEIVAEFYDAGVSGTEPIESRPGFAAMLDRIESNGVRIILVEDASRFARDLLVQEAGLAMLAHRGVRVLTSTGEDMTATDDPMRKMLRQIVGAVVEAEKARLVAKLPARGTGKPPPLAVTALRATATPRNALNFSAPSAGFVRPIPRRPCSNSRIS
jgi:DNA invertase Pin-like site-specific DNA recombinase